MNKLYKIFFLLTFIVHANMEAQVTLIGQGSFGGTNLIGPCNTGIQAGSASRYAYIWPSSTLGTLKHGDTIVSLSFHRNSTGRIQGNCSMLIYMRTTVNSNYGINGPLWSNLIGATGMKKVYDKDPRIDFDSLYGWVRFKLDVPYVVDTLFGKNLEVLVEYRQSSSQQSSLLWSFENNSSIGTSGFTSNQTKFITSTGAAQLNDTLKRATDLHPSLKIEFPRDNYEFMMSKLYSMGKLPVPQGNPDTVKAIVYNIGKKKQTFKLYLQSKGANRLLDSVNCTLNPLEEKLLNAPLLFPSSTGLDTLTGFVKGDISPSNDSSSSYRRATEFVYSYKDPTQPIAGGVGFSGSTGDFVAKFYSASQKSINQISVSFSGSNEQFKLGIWKADRAGGRPGTLVWESDTLKAAPSFITPVDPPVAVNGNFFVGVRQINRNNVGFGYQPDEPPRTKTFYYAAPLGDTNWTDFAPDAPFKFVIEPRIQAENDVAPLSYDFPTDTLWLINSKVMAPKATIINYGSKAQNTPFNVTMRIQRFNNQEFFSTKSITLDSGKRTRVTFDSSFYPLSAGQYDVMTYTRLSNDQLKDNDTLKSKLIVAAFKDVGPGTIFDPSVGMEYEQYVDTVFPTVFIQNYGLDAQGPFNVRAEIFDSAGSLVYADVKSQSLTALNSVIVAFKPYPCDFKGNYSFRVFTELGIDVDKSNDTVGRTFKVVRSNDVAITSIVYPANGVALSPPVAARRPEAVLENVGDANQADVFTSHCEIYFDGNLIYKDSVSSNSFRTIPNALLFKNFQPVGKGYYKMLVFSSLYADQNKKNDTMVSVFAVGVPDDVEVIDFSPADGSSLELNRPQATSVTIRNNGYNAQLTPFPVVYKVSRGIDLQYIKIKFVTLDSGETRTFVIDTSLVLDEKDKYEVAVYTLLGKDFKKSNDTLTGIFLTKKSKDLMLQAIIAPRSGDTLLLNTEYVEPWIRVRNAGDSAFTGRFRAYAKVSNASNNTQIYLKSIDTVMTPGTDSLDLKFPGFTISSTPINARILTYLTSAEDQFKGNDTSSVLVPFRIKYDSKANAISLPSQNSYVSNKRPPFGPQVRLSNEGLGTIPDFFAVLVIKKQDTTTLVETEVYRDTLRSGLIGPSEVKTYTCSRLFNPGSSGIGVYKAYLNVFSFDDQIANNNATQILFRIYEGVGVHVIQNHTFRIYPVPAKDYLYIESEIDLEASIEDVNGKTVQKIAINAGKNSIETASLSKGVYFINTGNGLIKFVVD